MNRHMPTRVAILLLPRHWAGSVMLARELLQIAGTLRTGRPDVGDEPLFDVVLAGLDRAPVASFGGLALAPEATLDELAHVDVAIVPAQFAPQADTSTEDARFAAWLRARHAQGAVVLSLAGSLLLAKSGLLDRREATGLLSERALFRGRFPLVRYLPTRRIIAQDDIVTVCGIGPTPDACAHLIERFHGAALARRFLRHTSTEALPPNEQTALWSARYKRHGDAPVLAMQEIVERELHDLPSLAELAARVGLSERTLSRRLLAATGLSLRRYAAALRLERAEFLLRNTELPLIHVAHDCGWGSLAAFSRAFSAHRSQGPAAYRRATLTTARRAAPRPVPPVGSAAGKA